METPYRPAAGGRCAARPPEALPRGGATSRRAAVALCAAAVTAFAVAACSSQGPELSELAQRGRAVYATNCTACHAADPNADGALGPAVAGSSLALLEARVLRAEYPPGYTPKRDTQVMVALPHLKPDLEALHAYLTEVARPAQGAAEPRG